MRTSIIRLFKKGKGTYSSYHAIIHGIYMSPSHFDYWHDQIQSNWQKLSADKKCGPIESMPAALRTDLEPMQIAISQSCTHVIQLTPR